MCGFGAHRHGLVAELTVGCKDLRDVAQLSWFCGCIVLHSGGDIVSQLSVSVYPPIRLLCSEHMIENTLGKGKKINCLP